VFTLVPCGALTGTVLWLAAYLLLGGTLACHNIPIKRILKTAFQAEVYLVMGIEYLGVELWLRYCDFKGVSGSKGCSANSRASAASIRRAALNAAGE